MSDPSFYLRVYPFPQTRAASAVHAEADGWTGLLFNDSPLLWQDAFTAVEAALQETERLKIGTAITSLSNRHPTVVANSACTWSQMFPGRIRMGVGRGDTSLTLAGLSIPSVADFEETLVGFDMLRRGLPWGDENRRLAWLDTSAPMPGLAVYGSGPKVLSIGARLGDDVTLTVGADRIRRAAGLVRAEAEQANRRVGVGAFVVVGVDHDDVLGVDIVKGQASISAHFQSSNVRQYSLHEQEILRHVIDSYDAAHHAQQHSVQAELLDPDFLDNFAVVGDTHRCREKISEILATGIDYLVMVGADRSIPDNIRLRHDRVLAQEVLAHV